MKKNVKISIVSATAIALLAGVAVTACGGPRHGRFDLERADKMVSWKLDDVMDELEATDVQREQLVAIKDRVFVRLAEEREAHKGMQPEFLLELAKDQPDPDKLHKLVDDKLEQLRPKLHEAVDVALEVHAVLTPEQRDKIEQRVKEHHAKRGGCMFRK